MSDEEVENLLVLKIDEAGIHLRLDRPIGHLIREARERMGRLKQVDPEIVSALTSVAAQQPELDPEESLKLLQTVDLAKLPRGAAISYSVSIAEAALRVGKEELVKKVLEPIVLGNDLPEDHPLLARALWLMADAKGGAEFALRSSRVGSRWLANSDHPEVVLGLQRGVDPISPLVRHAPHALPEAVLEVQNFALRKKLRGREALARSQTIVFVLYEQNFSSFYGAVVFGGQGDQWVDLGPAERIHERIQMTLKSGERLLLGKNIGSKFGTRLTQLWKSVWAPLVDRIDASKPLDIVPVGMLHAVPWAILRTRGGRFLCETCEEVRVVGATGVFPSMSVGEEGLIVCGVDQEPLRHHGRGDAFLSEVLNGLDALPAVQEEMGMLRGQKLFNVDRKDFIRVLKKRPRFFHFAGHGFAVGEGGEGFRSGLVVRGEGEGQLIYAIEISRMDLAGVKLIVLSSCRGGVGVGEARGNWSSVRRSFLAAGVESVLASQWKVRDDFLPDFMKRFYALEDRGGSRAGEFWRMQREMVKGADDLLLASVGAWVMECLPRRIDE